MLIDPLYNVLVHAANCQPEENAVAVFESAIRQGLVTVDELENVPVRSSRFRRLIESVSVLSDSGIESLPRIRLARIGITMEQQVMIRGHRVDGLIGERLVLQFDGAHHLERMQRRSDIEHDVQLRLMGYTVLRFDYDLVVNHWHKVESLILAAMAQGLHLRRG